MCKEAKILLIISALFTFAVGLSGIFVNVFFWKQTSSFITIVLFNLVQYIATPFTFLLGGIIAKRKNGIWSLRLGLMMYVIAYAFILFSGNRGRLYINIVGLLLGFAAGFYWLAFNTLCFDFTCLDNRDTFYGFNGSCAGIAAAVAPITSAFLISKFNGSRGYHVVFFAALSLFVVLILISLMLKCKNYSGKLEFKKIFSKNCEEWSTIRKATFLWGFRDVIIGFIVNILIIETTKSELSLGKLTLIASLLTSSSYILVQKIIKPKRRRMAIFIGTMASFAAVWGIAYKVTYTTLFIYVVLDAIFLPFFLIQMSSSTFNVINRAHDEDKRIEYLINKDIAINSGRSISAVILIALLSIFKNISILKVYLIFIGLAPVIAGYFLSRLKHVLDGTCECKCKGK
ncbi:MFS transporter [Clostridium sp. SYSU_GA19001]|uniref:MFS transporter n=1 Tax=Clostridium caldaquaticum TaxID=2940653 RepID=UPI002077608D|nr:MFS transporter [Clostridium caldaquaticum]MCM8709832.1 MFS transporter [Clostridium caldaquaticum]